MTQRLARNDIYPPFCRAAELRRWARMHQYSPARAGRRASIAVGALQPRVTTSLRRLGLQGTRWSLLRSLPTSTGNVDAVRCLVNLA